MTPPMATAFASASLIIASTAVYSTVSLKVHKTLEVHGNNENGAFFNFSVGAKRTVKGNPPNRLPSRLHQTT